jgi:hypothetical protein
MQVKDRASAFRHGGEIEPLQCGTYCGEERHIRDTSPEQIAIVASRTEEGTIA